MKGINKVSFSKINTNFESLSHRKHPRSSTISHYLSHLNRRKSQNILNTCNFDDLEDEEDLPLPNRIPSFLKNKDDIESKNSKYIKNMKRKSWCKSNDKIHDDILGKACKARDIAKIKNFKLSRLKNSSPVYFGKSDDMKYALKPSKTMQEIPSSFIPSQKESKVIKEISITFGTN